MSESAEGPLVAECEREALANSGLIQNEGALLHIDRESGLIDFVSDNSTVFLGDAPTELIGADGRAWILDFLPDLGDLPTGAGTRRLLENALDLGLGELDALISTTAKGWLIELEPAREPIAATSHIQLQTLSEPIDDAALGAAQQDLVDCVAEATGYDRVMLYEFKADWSGEVLAERVSRSKGTYLGLRFPASDIPAIARALYAQTPYRHIPNVKREPTGIQSTQGNSAELDLTWSDLRSVSPVHRQYLSNMHVAASFSVSVIVEGKLWGLVACHNPEPLSVPIATRIRCQELVSAYVIGLNAHRLQIQGTQLERLEQAMEPLPKAGSTHTHFLETFQDNLPNLAGLLDAEAASLVIDDRIIQSRKDDDPELIRKIHQWCIGHQSERIAAYEHLPEPLRSAQGTPPGGICGILSISLRSRRDRNRLVGLYFFRPEESLEIAWAGNPEKPVEVSDGAERLSPRNSFDKWVEIRTGFSRHWDALTLFTAAQLQQRLDAIL